MTAKLRIGVVGLGGIAQKAWLPVLGAADGWTLQAAWSPGKEKALRICDAWRIPYADSLEQLAAQCTRELAAQKVCSYANPFAMELAGWRPQLFSYDGDVFLVCCVRAARRREA